MNADASQGRTSGIGVTPLDKPFEIDDLMATVGEILPWRGGTS